MLSMANSKGRPKSTATQLLFILSLLAIGSASDDDDSPQIAANSTSNIPGCPDLALLEKATELSQDALDNLILCFCKVSGENGRVAIQCLYGSTLDHLEKAAAFVKKANRIVDQISIQHMEFPESGLSDGLLQGLAPELRSLEIRECAGQAPLVLSRNSLIGYESKLLNLTIHGCRLEEVPEAVADLDAIELLDLTDNKLYNLSKESFATKKTLRYLDISSNFINQIETDTFAPLESLETIIIGDHNYMNETVLEELGKLTSLKSLDFSRADGIFDPPAELFENLPKLEVLKLSGCSIENLEAGAFSALVNLEQLDLRVNLIANVSSYAFDGMKKLKRLSLAGNYIKNIESEIWAGLTELEELDLGWNELKDIPENAFGTLVDTLQVLNLRHNRFTETQGIRLFKKLKTINLSESEFIQEIGAESFKDLPQLEVLDLSRSNITTIKPDALEGLKESLKRLNLEKSRIKKLPKQLLTSFPKLEQIDVSGNPLICDSDLAQFIMAVHERYKAAAKEGKDFLLSNQNETICDRPYTLRGKAVFELDPVKLEPYSALLDTTTLPPTTTTTESSVEETTSILKLPTILVGAKTNETLFKEEPHREVYDVTKTDKSDLNSNKSGEDSPLAMPITLGTIALITLIGIVAIVAYMKKQRQVGDSSKSAPKKKTPADVEDGMVEIELRSNQGSTRSQRSLGKVANNGPSTGHRQQKPYKTNPNR